MTAVLRIKISPNPSFSKRGIFKTHQVGNNERAHVAAAFYGPSEAAGYVVIRSESTCE